MTEVVQEKENVVRREAAEMAESSAGWFDEGRQAWWHPLAKRVIGAGPVPRHVAFVMDGNRRYARQQGHSSVLRGHVAGFEQLAKILDWCNDLGVREVTVYAFSIENFKRSSSEVGGLMALAEHKFRQLLEQEEKLEEKQIRFRFFGDVGLLPPELRRLVARIELRTEGYSRAFVNVCMPYTSTNEMARAMEWCRRGREKGLVEEEQVSEWLLSRCMDTGESCDVDMLIRTSGEKRMSDFMLWQCSHSHIYFDSVLWPDFSFWHLCKAIASYQWWHGKVQALRPVPCTPSEEEREKLRPFLDWMREEKKERLREMAEL